MIKSPLFAEWRAQGIQHTIQKVLEVRFGQIPPSLVAQLQANLDEERLCELVRIAVLCLNLEAFQARLQV
jgi:hypothetical protein